MVKLCAVESCPSSRRSKRSKNVSSQCLSFFQPTTPSKLENWKKSLGFDLKKTDYICHLHFREEHVRMYDKVNIQGVIYYSYLHKKVLKEDALPTIEHQFHPPPQTSVTTHTKVKELLLKKQPCNNFGKNIEQVDLPKQIQIETSHKEEHHNTPLPGLLVERQANNYFTNDINTKDSLQKQITQSNLGDQQEGKQHQQTQQLKHAIPRLEPCNNIDIVQGLLREQQVNNYPINYIKAEDNYGMQLGNQLPQNIEEQQGGQEYPKLQNIQLVTPKKEPYCAIVLHGLCNNFGKNIEQVDLPKQVQIETSHKEEHHNTALPGLLVERQANNYFSNDINTKDSLQKQIAQSNLGNQQEGKQHQQTQQLKHAIPRLEPCNNIDVVQGLLREQQVNNYPINYIKAEDSFGMQLGNQLPQNIEEQQGGQEYPKLQNIQLITPKKEPYCAIVLHGLLINQQAKNCSINYIKTEDTFQVENQIAQRNSQDQNQIKEQQQTQQIQPSTRKLEPYNIIGIQGLLGQQNNNYSLNYIKTDDTLQGQIVNQFAQNNLGQEMEGTVQQQTQQIPFPLKEENNSNFELRGLSIDQQLNNGSVKYITTGDGFCEQFQNQFVHNNSGTIENQPTLQIQLDTPKQELQCNTALQGFLVDQLGNNYTMNYIKTDSFHDQIGRQFVQSNLENPRVEEEQQKTLKNKFSNLSVLPPYWLYTEKSEGLEVMRIDPTNMQIKNHLRLNPDLSITVIFLNKEEFLTKDKVSLHNFKSYLKSVEEWPFCVGTQVDKKYSKKCKGVIIVDECCKGHRKELRCKPCRILRNQLERLKLKKNAHKFFF